MREVWNVSVGEGDLVLQQLCQSPQPRATDDGHFRTLLRLGAQPGGRSLIVLVTVRRKDTKNKEYLVRTHPGYTWMKRFIFSSMYSHTVNISGIKKNKGNKI